MDLLNHTEFAVQAKIQYLLDRKKSPSTLRDLFLKRLSRFNSSERIILSLSFRSHPVCQALKQ